MEKNQIIEIAIKDMLDDGRGFGRYEGRAVFVSSGVLGDTVRAKVTKVKKSSAEAYLIEVIKPSPNRIQAECPYAHICGGCSFQELKYDSQKKLKEQNVIAKLTRIAGIESPKVGEIVGADTLKRYRNKATFAIGKKGEVGFFEKKSHNVVNTYDCMLQTEAAMACADALRTFLKKYRISTLKQMVVKTAFATGDVMVVLESETKDVPHIESLAAMLDEAVYSVGLDEDAFSLESLAVIHANKSRIIAGRNTILDEIANLKFEIGPQSFYQVNPEQMLRIYNKVAEYAELTGAETVLDLYCGVGTIGLFLADKADRVIGIESVKQAVIDANRNSVINNIINTRYICGKAEEELPRIIGTVKEGKEDKESLKGIQIDKADVVILDPPRAGADQKLLDAIIQTSPSRIVYVSCDAGTLARDIKYLTSNGYRFVECTPVDQFPWTNHVETVVLLSKGEVDSKKIRVEFSLEDMDMSEFQDGATYTQIKDYVLEHSGLKVSNLYISQIKRKCGIEVGKNYNLPKAEDSRQPQCPPEKEKAIRESFKYFGMI